MDSVGVKGCRAAICSEFANHLFMFELVLPRCNRARSSFCFTQKSKPGDQSFISWTGYSPLIMFYWLTIPFTLRCFLSNNTTEFLEPNYLPSKRQTLFQSVKCDALARRNLRLNSRYLLRCSDFQSQITLNSDGTTTRVETRKLSRSLSSAATSSTLIIFLFSSQSIVLSLEDKAPSFHGGDGVQALRAKLIIVMISIDKFPNMFDVESRRVRTPLGALAPEAAVPRSWALCIILCLGKLSLVRRYKRCWEIIVSLSVLSDSITRPASPRESQILKS